MRTFALIGVLILLIAFACASRSEAQELPLQIGVGFGEVLPDSIVTIKGFGELPLASLLKARGNLEVTSIFGTIVLPAEGLVLFQLEEGSDTLVPYLGLGAGFVFTFSDFGVMVGVSVSIVGGTKVSFRVPLFAQLKLRLSRERITYQFDAGVMF